LSKRQYLYHNLALHTLPSEAEAQFSIHMVEHFLEGMLDKEPMELYLDQLEYNLDNNLYHYCMTDLKSFHWDHMVIPHFGEEI
jgi:imidazoleglycerol phosphate dehydratase HisB